MADRTTSERDTLWRILTTLDRALPIIQPDPFHVWCYINTTLLAYLDEYHPELAQQERAKPQNASAQQGEGPCPPEPPASAPSQAAATGPSVTDAAPCTASPDQDNTPRPQPSVASATPGASSPDRPSETSPGAQTVGSLVTRTPGRQESSAIH